MNQIQLESLSEDERDMIFYIVNRLFPISSPKMEFDMTTIKWFRHDMLVKKLLNSFPSILIEGHPTYISLMQKLGVKIEVNQQSPPVPTPPSDPVTTPVNGSAETSGSISDQTDGASQNNN